MDAVNEMVKYYDPIATSIKVGKGLNAFHIAAKQGESEKLKVLIEAHPNLSMTYDASNTTASQKVATKGHKEVVNFFLELGSGLATIVSSNGKTALHAAARNGHSKVMKTLPSIFSIPDQYIDDIDRITLRLSLEEANISPEHAFMIFFVFDSIAPFISLVVVAIESEKKKKMMAILNKLM
ncbi:hypothetical protein Ancab_006013 [Ancistrocladus abbreviatus]